MNSPPVSEVLFERYLSASGLPWVYEPTFGGKRPDYLLPTVYGDVVIEVEELRDPEPLPVGGYSPTTAIRDTLRRAHRQLRGCRHLPNGIVVYSESIFRGVSAENLACAAFGPGFTSEWVQNGLSTPIPTLRFAAKHECPPDYPRLANPFLSRDQNKSVSAVIVLMRFRPNEFEIAIWRELRRRQALGEELRPGASLDIAAHLQADGSWSRRGEEMLRLVVFENPHANIPFPQVFFGPFDQRWTWQEDRCLPTWFGDRAAECLADGVPFYLF
jgi:hypothetical protein